MKEGWLYVVKAKVFHEGEDATQDPSVAGACRKGSKLARMTHWAAGRKDSKPTAITTRLVLWDMRDGKEMSAPAVKTGEWEVGWKWSPRLGARRLTHGNQRRPLFNAKCQVILFMGTEREVPKPSSGLVNASEGSEGTSSSALYKDKYRCICATNSAPEPTQIAILVNFVRTGETLPSPPAVLFT